MGTLWEKRESGVQWEPIRGPPGKRLQESKGSCRARLCGRYFSSRYFASSQICVVREKPQSASATSLQKATPSSTTIYALTHRSFPHVLHGYVSRLESFLPSLLCILILFCNMPVIGQRRRRSGSAPNMPGDEHPEWLPDFCGR